MSNVTVHASSDQSSIYHQSPDYNVTASTVTVYDDDVDSDRDVEDRPPMQLI